MKLIQTLFRLNREQRKWVKERATKFKIKRAAYVRNLIDEDMNKETVHSLLLDEVINFIKSTKKRQLADEPETVREEKNAINSHIEFLVKTLRHLDFFEKL